MIEVPGYLKIHLVERFTFVHRDTKLYENFIIQPRKFPKGYDRYVMSKDIVLYYVQDPGLVVMSNVITSGLMFSTSKDDYQIIICDYHRDYKVVLAWCIDTLLNEMGRIVG